ncbi:Transcription factor 20 [Trichoplax sp. H2]|nr:Transcription factor 20 [Trichoplax sp. H2]|eukprot:RDD45283.1 Transcription factor 20 [Trichoplax sp. H2]
MQSDDQQSESLPEEFITNSDQHNTITNIIKYQFICFYYPRTGLTLAISKQIITQQDELSTPIVKRKRGRPPGSKNRTKEQILNSSSKKVFGVIDPETGQFIKRGRGRPRKNTIPIIMDNCKTTSSHRRKGENHSSNIMKVKNIKQSPILSKKKTTNDSHNRYSAPSDANHILPSSHLISQNNNIGSQSSLLPCVRPKQWICSLCGFPSNYSILGALYGPFHYMDGHFVKNNHQSQQSVNRRLDSTGIVDNRNTGSNIANVTSLSEKEREEIWVHEDCIVWSPGVYLLGDTVVGLVDAVRVGRTNKCSVCGTFGDCLLDEDNFTLVCSKHKDCKHNMQALSPDAITWKKAFLKS